MIHSAYRKKAKRGVSTVLVVLLMVGLLFSAIIPIFISRARVDNHYDTTVVNMGITDHERGMEDVTFYAFGRDESHDLYVLLVNDGSITVNITRIWVRRIDLQRTNIFTSQNVSAALNGQDLPLQLNPSDKATIENLTLTIIVEDPDKDTFNIEVTTARGNVFPIINGPLNYQGGLWGTGLNWPWIEVFIRSNEGQDDFQVDVVDDTNNFTDTMYSWNVHGDYFTIIPVPKTGAYNVTATKTTQKMSPEPLYSQNGYIVETLNVTEMLPIAMIMFIDPE
jgi:hypothetical protein